MAAVEAGSGACDIRGGAARWRHLDASEVARQRSAEVDGGDGLYESQTLKDGLSFVLPEDRYEIRII